MGRCWVQGQGQEGQEKKRFKMTLDDEMLPGGDGNYLVRACSACASCFGSLPSKNQLRGEQGGGGGDRGASCEKASEMGRGKKRHQGQGVGLQGCETTLL